LYDTGAVTFADADATDNATANVVFVSDAASAGVMISGALHTALLSALTLQTSAFANAGTVNWNFNLDNSLVQYLTEGETVTATYSITVKDDSGTGTNTSVPQTVTVTITGTNDAPVISTANITLTPDGFGATKVSGISVSDVDDGGSGQFTLTTTADHGSIAPHISTGSISAINAALQNNLVYTPTDNSPIGHGTLTVMDNQRAFDVVNFVFRQSGSDPLLLAENTNQKDVLIGGTGVDQFVFAANSGQDTVLNFAQGTDKIDFQAISSIDTSALTAMLAQADHTGGNTLLSLNGTTDTLLVKGVATLNANDFILHA